MKIEDQFAKKWNAW